MGKAGLDAALDRGEPLTEICVRFKDGIDPVEATLRLNNFFDGFELHPAPWYHVPQLRMGWATKDALKQIFLWRLKRVPLEKLDEATGIWGHWPNYFRWEEINSPDLSHSQLDSIIECISISQPCHDDNGQWWDCES